MRVQKSVLAIGLIGTALIHGQAMGIIIRHDVDPSVHLELGSQSQFRSVGEVGFRNGAGGFAGLSGVLIDQNWVLTSAHRIAQDPDLNWEFRLNDVIYGIDEIINHPDYDGNVSGTTGADLALVRLSAPIVDTDPAQLSQNGLDFGDEITMVGFGGIGDGNGNGWTFTSERWAATNLWDQRPNQSEYYITDFDVPGSGAIPLEGSTTNGDTGAGIFRFFDGQWELAGLGSHTLDSNLDGLFGDYGDRARHTRLEVYRGWIDSIVPAPGGVGLAGAVGIFGCRRRRRSTHT